MSLARVVRSGPFGWLLLGVLVVHPPAGACLWLVAVGFLAWEVCR